MITACPTNPGLCPRGAMARDDYFRLTCPGLTQSTFLIPGISAYSRISHSESELFKKRDAFGLVSCQMIPPGGLRPGPQRPWAGRPAHLAVRRHHRLKSCLRRCLSGPGRAWVPDTESPLATGAAFHSSCWQQLEKCTYAEKNA